MTTCLLEFLVSLRVLNLMAMFDTMSGPLSRYHVAQRQVVAALFFNLSYEDGGKIGQKLIGSDAFISHWGSVGWGLFDVCACSVLLMLVAAKAECRGGSWEYRSETWADLWCETLWLRQQVLDKVLWFGMIWLVWCRLAKQLSLAEPLMLLNFSPLTADQPTVFIREGQLFDIFCKGCFCWGWFVC